MKMGQKTTLTKANVKSKSLRTTVPMGIRDQFGLEEGDKLIWKIEAKDNQRIIVVKPEKGRENNGT
jgi:bifunctional DNA-binding transcriptional regulator/antitoxin component of YhaV-PrlF toxin-antitoxin module